MKANEAPKKIYLNWVNYPLEEMQVEYTRTDAFIEKVMKYVANHFLAPGMDNEIKDFVNYMKGE